MKKIRIGKDIALKWAILTNGEPEPLQGRDLKIIILDPLRRKITVTGFETDGHIMSFRFPGTEQKSLGKYSLTLWENFGKVDMTAVDACNVFELVSTTCQEPTLNMESESVELQSNIQIGIKGASAFEIAVENGFQGTVEEWLQSLRQPAEDAASEANTQIGVMKTLETTIIQSEEQRKQAEQQRASSETAREQAEVQRSETFTQLQNDIDTLKREAGTSISNADTATAAANQAATQATQAAQSAETATRNATIAAENANAAGQSIVKLEQVIEQNEQTRISAEQSRSSAEAARQQAEQSRVSAEKSRASAETTREQQEQSRQSSEQQRVKDFNELKQSSETATHNANQATQSANVAAENANQAAATVNSRLSEVYANYAAIEASGETDTNKIYIDAETNTSYRYSGGKYINITGQVIEVESSNAELELQPNVYYRFAEMASIHITLGPSIPGIRNVYAFEFTSGYTPTVLSLPSYLTWENNEAPNITPYGQYIVRIVNGKVRIERYRYVMHPNLVAAWSAKGKTNNDVDKDVLIDLTGNGHDITLINVDFTTEGSGYDHPEYPDALYFDGVKSYGVNENMPILTDYTIIIKRISNENQNYYAAVVSKSTNTSDSKFGFIFENIFYKKTFSFDLESTINILKDAISFQTKNSYNQQVINSGNDQDGELIVIGARRNRTLGFFYWKGAFYSAYLFDRTLEPEEIRDFIRQYIDETYELPTV